MPITAEMPVDLFHVIAARPARVPVTEIARGKDWRRMLPEQGCLEIVDRNDTVGFVLSPDYAKYIGERIDQLQEDLEQAELEDLFRVRDSYGEAVSGEELRLAARALFDENSTAIEGYLSDGE